MTQRYLMPALVVMSCITATYEVTAEPQRFELWSGGPLPKASEIPLLKGVRFSVIKQREPEKDGYDWLHGVSIVRHKGTLFTCWGNNPGRENTVGEIVRGRRSSDDTQTWGPVEMLGPGVKENGKMVEAHSHGVFLKQNNRLWAFLARFGRGKGHFAGLAMEAFLLDEENDCWQSQGVVAQGIWPLREPVRMNNGNWFVSGCDENWRASVAISHGDDLTKWDTVKIPVDDRIYTEANFWIDGREIILVMRNHSPIDPAFNCAAVSVSNDYGRSWSQPVESNLPMTTSKPYCGTLSTNQRYLICNTVRDHNGRRWPLTIAVGRPDEKTLCRMWRIRDAIRSEAGDTQNMALSYPHAIELDGKLYIVYSSGIGGNRNHAELAVIPVSSLQVDK